MAGGAREHRGVRPAERVACPLRSLDLSPGGGKPKLLRLVGTVRALDAQVSEGGAGPSLGANGLAPPHLSKAGYLLTPTSQCPSCSWLFTHCSARPGGDFRGSPLGRRGREALLTL